LIDQRQVLRGGEAVLVGTVVAEEYRQPACERRLRMKIAIAVPLCPILGRTSSIHLPLQRVAIRISASSSDERSARQLKRGAATAK